MAWVKVENVLNAHGFAKFKYKKYIMKTKFLFLNPDSSLPVTNPPSQTQALCQMPEYPYSKILCLLLWLLNNEGVWWLSRKG